MAQNDMMYELVERTARMDGKLDILVSAIEKHESRLEAVEKHVHRGYGIIAAITFFVTAFSQYIWEKIIGRSS